MVFREEMQKQKVFGRNFEHVLNQRYVIQHQWVHHQSNINNICYNYNKTVFVIIIIKLGINHI